MGVFERTVRVSGPLPNVWADVHAVIDTGSDHCQFPRDVLEEVGATFGFKAWVLLPNAREVQADIYNITLHFDEYILNTTAYAGPNNGPALIGSVALSQIGLGVDPKGERLIPHVLHLLSETRWPTV